MFGTSVSVVIPALNEAANLPHVLPRIPADVDEIILVDGHSTDGSADVARAIRPEIRVVVQEGRGKGAALRSGVSAATGDIVVMLDADGSTDPAEIPAFVRALLNGADLVKGSRFLRDGGSDDLSAIRRLGNWGFVALANLLFRTDFTDITYGYRAIWKKHQDAIALEIDDWANEIVGNIRAAQQGLRVVEVASYEHRRLAGDAKLRTIPAGWMILKGILQERLKMEPAQQRHWLDMPLTLQAPGPTLPARPDVSVVICAYTEDRWDHIQAAIASALEQTVEPREIIVVVDYNEPLLKRLRRSVPAWQDIQVIRNTCTRGLSGARNSGVRVATGDVVAFLDDDAEAAPDWLEKLVDAYADPEVLGVGGSIAPVWPTEKPGWFPEEFNWVYGCTYRGLPVSTKPVRNFIGANMSFRRVVFETVGGFRPGIGRVGRHVVPAGGEETELCIRALQQWPDGKLMYEPAAVVHHHVTASRASWRYFLLRCMGEGKTKAALAQLVGTGASLKSERAYTFQVLPGGIARAVVEAALHGDPAGLQRAAAIVCGLAAATGWYTVHLALRAGRTAEHPLEELVPMIGRVVARAPARELAEVAV